MYLAVIIAISLVTLFIIRFFVLHVKPKPVPGPDIRNVRFDKPQFFGFVTKVPFFGEYTYFVQAHSVAEACAALQENGMFPLEVVHIGEVPEGM